MNEEQRKLLDEAREALACADPYACARLLPRLNDAFSQELIRGGKANLARRLDEAAVKIRVRGAAYLRDEDWAESATDFALWGVAELVGEVVSYLLLGLVGL